jgi:ribosomal protein L16 Arg81 hydroxylase
VFPGAAGRFADLVSWTELNRILRQHRLDFPRLRLALDGEVVPAHTYTDMVPSRRNGLVPTLSAAPLTEHLRRGATLVLDSVHEMVEPVAELAISLEHELRERVQVNVYAGWGKSHGFDVHWDDHDAFVLQLSGRKRWRMHGVTRPFPLRRDITPPPPPAAEPIADFLLEDGDVLYLPRGHWHDVSAIGEESLHLTIGFNRATGVDLVAWLADRLRAEEAFRDDLPRFADDRTRAERSAALRARIVALLGDDVVDRFLADRDATAPAHPHLGLPWSATSDLLPAEDHGRVRLLVPRAVVTHANGTVAIAAAGKRLVFAAAAEPVLTALLDGRPATIRSLVDQAPDLGGPTVRALLGELIAHGMLMPE